MKKIKYIIGIIILIVISCITIVYADYLYDSSNVEYNNSNSTLNSTSVQGAIDELYDKVSELNANSGECQEGYKCIELNKVTYDANGGTFNGETTNMVYYYLNGSEITTEISKTKNVDNEGNRLSGTDGYMPQASSGINDVVKVDGAKSLKITITYQTYSSSYSWVAVYDGSVTPTTSNYTSSISGQLAGTSTKTKTYIIESDTVQFFFYNSQSQTSANSNYLGYYATIDATFVGTREQGQYKEPTSSMNGYILKGWTTTKSENGTIYKSEKQAINSLNESNKDTVLYAQYFKPICKRATTLHTENCTNSNTSYYCQLRGHSLNETITYGKLGKSFVLSAGDAFDCDVNNDGTYDSATERFYYVSDYFDTGTTTFDSNYATLIYYSNYFSGNPTTLKSDVESWYANSNNNAYGPTTAITVLPTTSQWRDGLLKSTTRNILNDSGTVKKSNFSYAGYAARLLTLQELITGCNGLYWTTCEFLMERTNYSNNDYVNGYWLETASSYSNPQYALRLTSGTNGSSPDTSSKTSDKYYGVRPVIEVSKTNILY